MDRSDWVERLIGNAVRLGASDIHIEPSRAGYQVRIRKDGDLLQMPDLPPGDAGSVQRIKVLAEMDIAERRMPQDGSFQTRTENGDPLDIRVATLPTVQGEKLVMRLLRHTPQLQNLDQLDMERDMLEQFRTFLNCPHGMLIAAGPTGSGKSTTLFAALRFLRERRLNIVTLEDPVETRIAGISQVQVNERAGLTFAKGLRSILRQDPDVILVGEIRDQETAEIAVRAALTGHLVLTTLHADTTEGALIRLIDIGVEPYLVAGAVKAVLTQRLVKRCGGGRRAIFDLLAVDEDVRNWLMQGAHPLRRPHGRRRSRLEEGLRQLVKKGEVTAEEYVRLCGGDLSWLEAADSGATSVNSPGFVREWPDCYEAGLRSTRV